MGKSRARAAVAGVAVLAVLVAGCSAEVPEYRPVAHAPVGTPPDRDEQSALAVLRELDLCKLIAPSGGGSYSNPHTCYVDHDGAPSYYAMVDERGPQRQAVIGETVTTVGGVKAYWHQADDTSCLFAIPVTFRYAIDIDAHAPLGDHAKRDYCAAARKASAAAVGLLTRPQRIRRSATPGYVIWDSCSALGTALSSTATGMVPANPAGGLDDCTFQPARSTDPASYREVTLRVAGFSSAPHDSSGGEHKSIGDKDVMVTNCTATWDQGPYGDDYLAQFSLNLLPVAGKPCAQLEALTADVIRVLGTSPPAPGTTPKLGYAPNEPDRPLLGACADYSRAVPGACLPYQPVPLPQGTEQTTRAVLADPHVACAVALAAVHHRIGTELQPVADLSQQVKPDPYGDEGGCAFVSPQHQVEVRFQVAVSGGFVTRDQQIGGHPGTVFTQPGQYTVSVNTGVSLGHGQMQWTLDVSVPAELGKQVRPSASQLDNVVAALTDITTQFFDR